ncbi:MAG: sugar transferase [Candidatus Hydrogenedentota bacterium]
MALFETLPREPAHGEGGSASPRHPKDEADGGGRVRPVSINIPYLSVKFRGLRRARVAAAQRQMPAPLPLAPQFAVPFPRWKRAMDVAGAAAGIVLTAPLMLGVAAAVKLTCRGPVLFKQERGGLGGQPFTVYKFRTMVADAETQKPHLLHLNERKGPAFKMKDDPRVTRLGQILRMLSLDELPQFFNVLKGDMSLVGPRPLPVKEDEELALWQRMRLETKPGITGLWQVTSRDRSCFDEWMRLDIRYIKELSFWLDVKLLLLTIPAVVSRKGAH